MSIDAMKQALDALKSDNPDIQLRAAIALRLAIAHAEQAQPVANDWSVFNAGAEVSSGMSLADAVAELTPKRMERGWSAVCVINKDNPPLYTTPPQRKPLTDEEIDALPLPPSGKATVRDLVRIIEAAHGIKENT